ncbi:MAG: hypothetical protein Q8O33_15225 [Pseudomonadota bacterium]|nr:hypothetical protein [Pseudomonadota bacterium]
MAWGKMTEQERREDEARWVHYLVEGQAIEQERVMAWLDQLAKGRRDPPEPALRSTREPG